MVTFKTLAARFSRKARETAPQDGQGERLLLDVHRAAMETLAAALQESVGKLAEKARERGLPQPWQVVARDRTGLVVGTTSQAEPLRLELSNEAWLYEAPIRLELTASDGRGAQEIMAATAERQAAGPRR